MNGVWCVRVAAINLLLAVGFGAIAGAQQGSASPASSSSLLGASDSSSANNGAAVRSARVVAPPQSAQQVDLYGAPVHPFSKFALGAEFGSLGLGLQAATPLTRTLNLRAGADFLNFGSGFTVDAAQYESQAHLRSGHISVDWHPMGGGFRISPELLIFKSGFSASVFVAGGQAFELGNTPYVSSATDPVHGGASISMQKTVMPALTIGFGNLIGERRRHWSIPFEIGAAYTGHYTLNLNLAGTACVNYINCMSTSSPQVQNSVHQEESDINETMKHFQVYPIVSTGVAYRF